MKTNITIGVVAVVAVAIGAYFFWGNDSSNDLSSGMPVPGTNTEETVVTEANGKKMAFSEFVKQGGSYRCTINQNINGAETTGVTYVSDNLVRGEFNTKVSGMNISSNIIVMDGFTYSWNSAYPTLGFKSKATAGTSGSASTGTSGNYSFGLDQIGDYNCENWTFDSTVFALPPGVTFKEV